MDKYEYLTDEKISPSNQKKIIEQAKSIYAPLVKAFEIQIKTNEDQVERQVKILKELKKTINKSKQK